MNGEEIDHKEWMAAKASLYAASEQNYYDEINDEKSKEAYYHQICFEDNDLADTLHRLLLDTHTHPLPYSPHRYVYPWVDIQENRQLKSLYSGQEMDPLRVIEADLKLLAIMEKGEASLLSQEMKFNCEHVVPQSWFQKKEPMRGDLHHLFACDPSCNSSRGNSPYYDFPSYSPSGLSLRTGCGLAEDGKFEPEYGKGIAARAVFYFYIRYKGIVSIEDKMDLNTLKKWHTEYPVSLYEKHRNAAIYELQGNRNPFIDFPNLVAGIIMPEYSVKTL
ncbi:endonuclease I family protein [Neobacillus terrae]|uniref:endonuclease I family protein n=1 Tax=Neobacillus terrae TaxID=3034837 RepID=UPI0014075539|nr:endonuclease [Neobacillus terrae]NHM33655.1 endonuclease I [Neobacillus terrae]